MALSQIIILKCFSNLPFGKLSIFVEIVHFLSQLKFHGEGGTFLTKNINYFIGFYRSLEIDDEYVMSILFTLGLEGHVN